MWTGSSRVWRSRSIVFFGDTGSTSSCPTRQTICSRNSLRAAVGVLVGDGCPGPRREVLAPGRSFATESPFLGGEMLLTDRRSSRRRSGLRERRPKDRVPRASIKRSDCERPRGSRRASRVAASPSAERTRTPTPPGGEGDTNNEQLVEDRERAKANTFETAARDYRFERTTDQGKRRELAVQQALGGRKDAGPLAVLFGFTGHKPVCG